MSDFDYESIPAGYYDFVYKKNHGVQSAWHQIKFDHVFKYIQAKDSHIDIGCGPGTFIGNYLSGRDDVIGYDISELQIEYAKTTYPDCHFEVVGSSLPLQDSSIASVSLIEVIEHLDATQIATLLNQVSRVLKIDGRLIITTPNYKSLWPLIEWFLNRLSNVSYEEQHISKFNKRKLCNVLTAHGFKVGQITTSNLMAPFLAVFGNSCVKFVLKVEKYLGFLPGSILCVVAIKK